MLRVQGKNILSHVFILNYEYIIMSTYQAPTIAITVNSLCNLRDIHATARGTHNIEVLYIDKLLYTFLF